MKIAPSINPPERILTRVLPENQAHDKHSADEAHRGMPGNHAADEKIGKANEAPARSSRAQTAAMVAEQKRRDNRPIPLFAIMASGVALDTASGKTHAVMLFENARNMTIRACDGGVGEVFADAAEQTPLTATIATSAPKTACHRGIDTGRFIASSTPVTAAENHQMVLGLPQSFS